MIALFTQKLTQTALTKKPFFWILFTIITLAAGLFSVHYFSKVMPFIAVDLKMDRSDALTQAQILTKKYNWAHEHYDTAVEFDQESMLQFYCELECGGTATFTDMITQNIYQPYQWSVRYFKEHQTEETHIYFTPAGIPYGFRLIIPEDKLLENLSQTDARILALDQATRNWNMPLEEYTEVEASSETKPNGRVDHTFTYEHTTKKLGQALYRIVLVVTGNTFSCYLQSVKLPEEFLRRYAHMRATNRALATGFNFVVKILYFIFGLLIGCFVLLKQKRFLVKPAGIIAFILALCTLLQDINNFPLSWISYDTATNTRTFMYHYFLNSANSFIYIFLTNFLIIGVAEGLSRWAFGNHHQLFKSYSKNAGRSFTIIGHTITGYYFGIIEFAVTTIIYFLLTRMLGWWAPASTLIDPNILATPMPFFSPFVTALSAGVIEECLCRALPLAGAVLLGRYLKKEKLCIIIALILQAIVFGGLHTTYVQQPAYFRIVELFIPSCLWGLIYLRFGLIISIIAHYLYDLVLMTLPIFANHAPHGLFQKILVIFCALTPVIILVVRIIQQKKLEDLPDAYRNKNWQQPTTHTQTQHTKEPITFTLPKCWRKTACIVSYALLCSLGALIYQRNSYKPLYNYVIPKEQAIVIAQNYFQELLKKQQETYETSNTDICNWTLITNISSEKNQADRCIWQTESPETYTKLLENYIPGNYWTLNFVRFPQTRQDAEQCAEEYIFYINSQGALFRYTHVLPENTPGVLLEKAEARGIALDFIQKNYHLPLAHIKEISAIDTKQPHRKDWEFIFQDTSVELHVAQARLSITIAGDKIINYQKYIFVPEMWCRQDTNKQATYSFIASLCALLIWLLSIISFWPVSKALVWQFSFKRTMLWALFFLFIIVLTIFNKFPDIIYTFSNAQPYTSQLFSTILAIVNNALTKTIFFSLCAAHLPLLLAYTSSKSNSYNNSSSSTYSLRTMFIYGLNLGCISFYVLFLVKQLIPTVSPESISLAAWNSNIPFITILSETFVPTLRNSIMALLFVLGIRNLLQTNFAQKTIFKPLLFCFLAITSFSMAGYFSINSLTEWLILGTITTSIFIILLRVGCLLKPTLIIPVIAAYTMLDTIDSGLKSNAPHALFFYIITALLLVLCNYFIFLYFSTNTTNNTHDTTSP